jgi:M6 family metalloprotease-like protein
MRGRSVKSIIVGISTSLLLAGSSFADDLAHQVLQCGTQPNPQYSRPVGKVGGLHITAAGTLRILIVFASFHDDETPHPFWPAHNPPLFMQQFIDPDTITNSQTTFNLTHYFHQMSLGQFHLVGDAIWVESTHSQQDYANGSYARANINLLNESVDPLIDFALYDNWTNQGDYQNFNSPDGIVDMIVMVWRTTIFGLLGEASLGYRAGFVLDGKRIETGFPERFDFPLGSGVTCEYPYSDDPSKVMRTIAHELGHWLLGGAHPYNGTSLTDKHQFWGILCAGQRISSCANAYERERLGWITIPEIQPDLNIPLPDFLSSGTAYKYHPPNGDPLEYFYVENHQMLSPLDDVTLNPDDKGIWILHQLGPYAELDNLRIRPSDGNWHWENPGVTTACFSQGLPVFARGEPGVLTGQSHRDQIPISTSLVNWMYAYKNFTGKVDCGLFCGGQAFSGSYNATSTTVFSPYSNPNSNTWDNQQTSFSLEIVSEGGGATTIRYNSNPLDAAPARRFLGHDPAFPAHQSGRISLAWGSQWLEGQPLEPDINWSELQCQIGSAGNWTGAYEGPATSWADGSLNYDTNGTVPLLFRVRVRNSQSRYSSWSEVFYTRVMATSGTDHQLTNGSPLPGQSALGDGFPNPFNPATTISYQLSAPGFVSLKVYDLLGHEVAVLVNERKPAGRYTVQFHASELSSGVYLYQLRAGGVVETKKLLLLR